MFRLTFEMTNDCNMGCRYCYSVNRKRYISQEIMMRAFDLAIKEVKEINENELYINFLGGEPLLNYKLINKMVVIFDRLGNKESIKVFYGITSNLTLLDHDILKFFIDHKFSIRTSIDGTKESHDKNRFMLTRESSYDIWVEKIPLLKLYQKEMRQEVQISMVISPNTITEISENFKHIVNLGFTRIFTALETYSNWSESELEVVKREYIKIVNFIFVNAKNGKKIYWNFLQPIQDIYTKKYKHFFCYTGKNSIYVKTDGNIYACSLCQKNKMKIGTVNDGFNQNREKFICYERSLSEKCQHCKYLNVCVGVDCVAAKYELNNNFSDVPLFICYTTKMRDEIKVYIDRLIANNT